MNNNIKKTTITLNKMALNKIPYTAKNYIFLLGVHVVRKYVLLRLKCKKGWKFAYTCNTNVASLVLLVCRG